VFYAFTGEIKDANITVACNEKELEPVSVQIVAVDTHLLSPSSWRSIATSSAFASTNSKTNLTLAQQASIVTSELSSLDAKLVTASDKRPTWLLVVGRSSIYSSHLHGDNTELASYLQPLLQTHKPSAYFSLHNRINEHVRMSDIDEFAAKRNAGDNGGVGGSSTPGASSWQSSSSPSSSSQALLVWPQQPSNTSSNSNNNTAARFADALTTTTVITITANYTSLVVRLVDYSSSSSGSSNSSGNDNSKEIYIYTLTKPFTTNDNNNNNNNDDDDEHKQQPFTSANRSTLAKTLISLTVFAISALAAAAVQFLRGQGGEKEGGKGGGRGGREGTEEEEGRGEEEGAIQQQQQRHQKQQDCAKGRIAIASPFSSLLEAAYRGSGINSSSCFGSSYDGITSPPKKTSRVAFSLLKPRSASDKQQQQHQYQHARKHSSFSSASIFTSIASLREYVLQNEDDEPFSSTHSSFSHQRRGSSQARGGGDDLQARFPSNNL